MLCTCLWNHFRGSTRMEPMVLMTSGWFRHYSSFLGHLILASFLHQHYSLLFSSGVQCVLFVGGSCLYAVLRPYKSNFRNNIDFLILILLEILSLTFVLETYFPASNLFTYCVLVSVLLLSIPHLIMVFYVCYHLVKKTGIAQYLKEKCKALKRYICTFNTANQAEIDVEAQSVTDSLPDRLINPEEYEPLLPHCREKHNR